MGVDSGLGTFRGRNAGVWPPLKAMQMDFSEMSSPGFFNHDPRLAWAFWKFRHQAYVLGAPHDGYRILAKWGQKMRHGCFSVTSNIDGHWERTEGIGEGRIYECHGALTRMQCVEDRCREAGSIWRTDPEEIARIAVPEWDLVPGESVLVRRSSGSTEEVEAVVQDDGCSLAVDGRPIAARAVRRRDGPDLLRALPTSPLPVSSDKQPARPNVLMFGDWGVNDDIISAQNQAFRAWMGEMPTDAKLVVVEVGAGKAVPTIRMHSERVLSQCENATLIRINWDDSDVPAALKARSVSIGGVGALDALSQLDKML
ncbi:cobB [Symbiodinium sp. CCMP2456]|nr:cobB [Symbiodinium sp. CCMP2456]